MCIRDRYYWNVDLCTLRSDDCGDRSDVTIGFLDYDTTAAFNLAVDKEINVERGTQTRIHQGLETALLKMFHDDNGMRPSTVNKTAILLTDGNNDGRKLKQWGFRERYMEANIKLIVIGVGDRNSVIEDEVDSVVESQSDFYLADNFDDLVSDGFFKRINCKEITGEM